MRYAELHCKTNFSFLEGASHPSELVARAAELQYAALAITDRNSLAGIVRAHGAWKEWAGKEGAGKDGAGNTGAGNTGAGNAGAGNAEAGNAEAGKVEAGYAEAGYAEAGKAAGFKLLVGSEITPRDAPHVVLWTTDRSSYGRLCRLITRGRRNAPKGECELTLSDIADFQQGLLAGVAPGHRLDARSLGCYREIFGDRCYLLAELHKGPHDQHRLAELRTLSEQTKVPLVAAGNVHYHTPARMVVHDVLTAIRNGTTVADADGDMLFSNAQRHLREVEELRLLYASCPEAVHRTLEIAERSRFSLDELRYEYPTELTPDEQTPIQFLSELTWAGAKERYPTGIPGAVGTQLEHELQLIEALRYEAYFLTVWDLVRFARSRDILCQGRGSAANSAVCFCLGVTSVDPVLTDLLFERFISKERDEAPDIDVDFEHQRREEVLQYAYNKYGREHSGLTATVITYRSRSVIRDVGKALGLSLDRVDALAKQVDGHHNESHLARRCHEVGIDPRSPIAQRFLFVVHAMTGFPRHLSQHTGGMVFTAGPLCELVPIENAAMPDRTVIQWDKDDLDELGILKVDCLSLGMLTAIHKCFDLVREQAGRDLTLASIPQAETQVYDMICAADTIGVFQIESRAQMSMLPRLKPRCFYDLVIEIAIVRPGPIQGNMVHPYLRRRAGDETATYPSDAIRQVLEKTLGVPIFQEQAMKLAVVAAGFTPGEADQLRRAMAAWRRPGLIDQFRKKLLRGMQAKGFDEAFAEGVYNQIRGFGEYGFPESHAASFALLVYASAWLKCHYPAAFAAALINSQPLGFYAPAQLIRDARDHQVDVLPVDVQLSHWDCTLGQWDCTLGQWDCTQEPALRLGFRMISGLRKEFVNTIVHARLDGPFRSIDDFARRTRFNRATIKQLAQADVFQSLGQHRRQALWQAAAQEKKNKPLPLFNAIDVQESDPVPLPELTPREEVVADYRATGLSLRGHPIAFHREQLSQLGVVVSQDLAKLASDSSVCVAGLVLLRQRPATAKGITFVTLEDEAGTVNLIVHQRTWQRYYRICRRSPAWIVYGQLQSAESVIHVVVKKIEELSGRLSQLQTKSRDFR